MEAKGIEKQDGKQAEKQPVNPEVQRLTALVKELEDKNAALAADCERQLAALRMENEVDRALLQARVKNAKAVKALLKMEDVVLENGTLKGLTEQLAALRENASYLFEEEQKPRVRVSSAADHGESSVQAQSLKSALNAYYAN